MIDLGINLFQEIAALGGGGGGYSISNSLRFNDNDSAYLSRTPSVAGDRKTWTWSGWVKRGNVGNLQMFFAASNQSTTQGYIGFNSDDSIAFFDYISASNVSVLTDAVCRDVSGWYHIVVVFDTTQATGSDRVKFYINGVEQATNYNLTPSLNYEGSINRTDVHGIGREEFGNTYYFDGYLAEVNFIDGQALTADDFGEINEDTGEWSPKKYSGTYGTNGFYLPFNGNANDSSGNGNNWTENNLASTDYMIDTPTNNFATLNPLDSTNVGTAGSYSEGNLKYITSGNLTSNNGTKATMAFNSGKWYWENVWASTPLTTYPQAGILRSDINFDDAFGNALASTGGYGVSGDGKKFIDGASTSSGISWSTGDIVQIAVDMDNRYIYIGKNGVWQFSGVPTSGASGTGALSSLSDYYYAPIAGDNNYVSAATMLLNFGQDSSFAGLKTRQGNTDANGIGDFYYTPPTGYLALCTDNLPAPAIVDSETQFNVVTYTGDNTLSRTITGVGFEPDFVWIKRRNQAASHALFDSVRGATKMLSSDLTDAEATRADTLTSFDSDGFTVSDSGFVNDTADTYVAWCWKAGGTAVTNTDGTITSQVSANVDAGFSIVGYAGNGSAVTVGHGLSSAPEMIITKNRDGAYSWLVQTSKVDGSWDYLVLDTTAAKVDLGATWEPTSSVMTFASASNTINKSGSDHIAYCFHSVEGFSKFGSYVGNGSTDGTFVYTGFKPAFVMIKNTQNGITSWVIADSKRNTFNEVDLWLQPNTSGAESNLGTTYDIDFLSNGFKIRESANFLNQSTYTLIYMAFAEAPFKNAVAR